MKLPAVLALVAVLVAAIVAGCTSPVDLEASAGAEGSRASAGQDGGATTTEKNASGLPCAVKKVLEEKCQLCHGAETTYGASTSLVTLADLKRSFGGKKVSDLVMARVRDDARPMPPVTAPALSEVDRRTLVDWLEGGLPAGEEAACEATQRADVPKLSCATNLSLVAKTPYRMKQGGPSDEYVCFGVDVTSDKKKHLVGFGPKVDNKKILHHILVFEANESVSPEPQPCTPFQAKWKVVTGWAPGGTAFELPKAAGIPLAAGTTHYAVQLHYNNAAAGADETDQSGFDVCTTEELRPNDAGVLAFGSVKINIPPRSEETVSCDYTLDERFDGATFFSVNPHMHKAGMSIGTRRLANGTGPEEDVFVQQRFDFENQANNPIDVKVKAGDVFRTSCLFKNPGDQTIKFGENTADEMCFNFMTYYPLVPDRAGAIGLPLGKRLPGGGFNWITPSVEGCGLSLGDLNELRKQL